jgi:hypothetical protein
MHFGPSFQNVNQFRQALLIALGKYKEISTQKTAQDEVRELMTEHVTNNERMNVLIFHICDFNDSMRANQKKEHIKLLGQAGEIFEGKLIPFLPKILPFF